MKIVYIAGPLTTGWDGKDRDFIERKIAKAEEFQIALANAGIGAFCPHAHTAFHHEKGSTAPETYYYQLDFELLMRAADAVLAMPGWETSRGATKEIEWAIEHKLPVFYPSSPEDIGELVSELK